jgi:protein O-GlcNAc transferase
MGPMTVNQAMNLGFGHHQAGRLGEAEKVYRQVLAAVPGHPDAEHLLGLIALRMGNYTAAAAHISVAAAKQPGNADAHANLGIALIRLGKLDEGIASCRKSLELIPDRAEVTTFISVALTEKWLEGREEGLLDEAEKLAARAVELKPDHAEGWVQVAALAAYRGRVEEAKALYRRAIALNPGNAEAKANLGEMLAAEGDAEGAISLFQQAVDLNPVLWRTQVKLGCMLADKGRLTDGIKAFRTALRVRSDDADALRGLGWSLFLARQNDESAVVLRKAVELHPNDAGAWRNLGPVLSGLQRHEEALAALLKAEQLVPMHPGIHNNLGNINLELGNYDEAIRHFRLAIEQDKGDWAVHGNMIYAMHFPDGITADEIAELCAEWNRRHAIPLRETLRGHDNPPQPARRLKIGYVSADFRYHASAFFLIPLLRHHDPAEVEVYCYAEVATEDGSTQQMKALVPHWRMTTGKSADEVAAMVRADGIDVLVDLKLHTAENRMDIFTRKPAPVQVSWLGYPGQTGIETIGHAILDRFMDPVPGGSPGIVHLPDCYWSYDPLIETVGEVAVAELPALRCGHVTFGCLNRFTKVSASAARLWAEVLKAVPGSRLMLMAEEGAVRGRALELFASAGVEAERVGFVGRQPRAAYLATYGEIDFGLDPFPYNGHTTGLDSLYMGVPYVTLVGSTPVARAGYSLLSHVGLPDLVTWSEADYVRRAAAAVSDLPKLAETRRTLRGRMENSPLMDHRKFAAGMERIYRELWKRWCAERGGG